MGPLKTCSKCHTPKPEDEFGHRGGGMKRAYCKLCRNKQRDPVAAQHLYQERRDRRLAEQRRQRARRKLLVLGHYSGGEPKCACCNEQAIEFLTIDHINGGGERHRLKLATGRKTSHGRPNFGGGAMYFWLIQNGFPDGFRVLCFNCNSALGLFGYCPHQAGKLPVLSQVASTQA